MSARAASDGPVAEALRALGIERLVLGVHQAAFPAGAWDAGVGAPAGAAGRALLEFAAELGFTALQLGPGGQVSLVNPSPYDGTAFARSLTSISLERYLDEGLVEGDALAALCEPRAGEHANPGRTDLGRALRVSEAALALAHHAMGARHGDPAFGRLREQLDGFRHAQAAWLEQDAFFEVLAVRIGHDDTARFDPSVAALLAEGSDASARRRSLRATLGADVQRRELGQWLAECDARALREHARGLGLELLGDLQIGWSHRDRFLHPRAFDTRFLLGAPPSRTNPEGQPWGYPLLDPEQLDDPASPARRLFELRLQRVLSVHDGVRIDHPHGLVCPWIYEARDDDPLRAVQQGTRAFESPDLDDATLARWAIARPQDLDPAAPRHADGWVKQADAGQVERWSRLMDVVVAAARAAHGGQAALAVEVLSTCPEPLRRVLERHGLGRFRVVQKADVDRAGDVYRTDQAQPQDWVMLGNHDTPSLWSRASEWLTQGTAAPRARYLAERLEPDPGQRSAAAEAMCRSPGALVQAHLADVFACDARNVFVYFTDLFGETEPYNRPGVVDARNWSMRISRCFRDTWTARRAAGGALDLRAALAWALRARGLRPELSAALKAGVAI